MRMNRFVVGAVASLLALGTVAPAFADNDHRGRGHDRHDDRHDRRHDRHDRHDRRDWRDDRRREAHHDRRYYDNRGYYRPAPPPRVVYRPQTLEFRAEHLQGSFSDAPIAGPRGCPATPPIPPPGPDRKSTRLNSSHGAKSRMPSSA